MKMLWSHIVAIAFLGTASAQNLSLGIGAGGAPTDAFESITTPGHSFYSQSADYLIGATLEYHLLRNLSVEADVLFRELHLTETTTGYLTHTPVVTWEFPVLAKYRFHERKFTPFVEAGPEFRTTGNLNSTNPSHAGVAAGAGLETHWRGLDIAPTVRYTRWVRDDVSSGPESKADQLEVLLGLSTRPRSLDNPIAGRFALGVIIGTTLTHDLASNSMPVQLLIQPPPLGVFPPPTEAGTAYTSGADTFIYGPALEVALSQRFYIEADAVDHAFRYVSRTVLNDGSKLPAYSGTAVTTWEIPVLAKIRFGSGPFKPFAEAGPSFRLPVDSISPIGLSVGGGVEIRWRFLKIAPTIRYTRWGETKSFNLGYQQVQLNQVEFLASFLL
jgi:Outer membrane protein beta-barrel domain